MSVPDFDPKSDNIFKSKYRFCTACVGSNGLSDIQTYARGYFNAAEILLSQVVDRQNNLTQDTLVYPILFNLRHGVELSVKHVSDVLSSAGLTLPNTNSNIHDLHQLWIWLNGQSQADRRLIAALQELAPGVLQIHDADPLAEEFRYAKRNDGVPSLQDRRIVDLVTVLSLTKFISNKFRELFYLADRIAEERRVGSFTSGLNRPELEQLSKDLPPLNTWKGSARFMVVRDDWKSRFELSSNAFSRAVNFIKNHREFSGNIGQPKPFTSLTDADLEGLLSASLALLAEQMQRSSTNWAERPALNRSERAKFDSCGLTLNATMVGEVKALFYLGRNEELSEEYDPMCERYIRDHEFSSDENLWDAFEHVFSKTNFAECICRAVRLTGHKAIAEKFEPQIAALVLNRSSAASAPTIP